MQVRGRRYRAADYVPLTSADRKHRRAFASAGAPPPRARHRALPQRRGQAAIALRQQTAAVARVVLFEGLARQQEHYALLTRRMRYDRLGINDALLQFESDLNRGLMPEPKRLIPLLD